MFVFDNLKEFGKWLKIQSEDKKRGITLAARKKDAAWLRAQAAELTYLAALIESGDLILKSEKGA